MITIVLDPGGYFSIDVTAIGYSEDEVDQVAYGTMPEVCYEHMIEKVKEAMFDLYHLQTVGSC